MKIADSQYKPSIRIVKLFPSQDDFASKPREFRWFRRVFYEVYFLFEYHSSLFQLF